MKKALVLIALLGLTKFTISQIIQTEDGHYQYEDHDSSIEKYSALIKEYPFIIENFSTHYDEDIKTLIKKYSKEIKLNPNKSENYLYRARLYNAIDNRKAAINDYNVVASKNPSYSGVFYERAQVFRYMGEKFADQAEADYTKAINLAPNAITYYRRGGFRAGINKPEQALSDIDSAITLGTGYTNYEKKHFYSTKGAVLMSLNRFDEAIQAYTFALENNSNRTFFDCHLQRGEAYFELKKYKEAINDYTIQLDSSQAWTNFKTYVKRGLAKENLNDLIGAIADYTAALELDESYAKAYYLRGKVLLKQNNPQGCEDLQKALNLGMEEAKTALVQYCN